MKPDYFRHADGRKKTPEERLATYKPPKPKPKPESAVPQRYDTLKAEREGRAEAAAKMAPPQNPNPYARQYRELEKRGALTPEDQRQLLRFKRWAKQWDRDNAERLEREAKLAELRSDPGYRNAVEHATAFMRTPPHPDDATAAAAAYGYLTESGDVQGYWAKVAEVEESRWREASDQTSALALEANAAMNKFNEAASKAADASARMREAKSNSEGTNNESV